MESVLHPAKVSNKKRKFHLWLPDIFAFKGGIQVYSAFLLQAIQNIYQEADYSVFLKHDKGYSPNSLYLPDTNFHFAGKIPLSLRTPFFATQLIANGIWQKPDLVITTHLNFTVAAYWLKRLMGIPYVTIAHGVEAWNITNPKKQKALQYADKILAVSNYTRERLLTEQDLDPSKVSLLPNTFNSDRFTIKSKPTYLLDQYQLKPNQPVILTVNRLSSRESYRGYDRIIEALPYIRQHIPNVHYIIVGKGDDRQRLEKSITQQNLQDCVTLAGFIPDAELPAYYQLCDLFAMPSKLEGFGIVYLEALASGKPVLGGNQDGAIDALCQGELGVLVDPDDVEEIANKIVAILQKTYSHPVLYQPEKLREKVIQKFGSTQFKNNLEQQLSMLLSSHHAK
ncbi:MAG: glycosyltransferase family 4 protein [Xenococcaceae cyanobacterium MO_167.B27]|nr:glycosyltransferase family 4 protein [Xenococcaceae cyanobacterium MO_167.B27]